MSRRPTLAALALTASLGVTATACDGATPTEAEDQARAASRLPAERPGFRPDAWFLPDDPRLGFVPIPAGDVVMGSDPDRDRLAYDNERWSESAFQGRVSVPAFWIARNETTVAQLRAFAAATGAPLDRRALDGPLDHPAAHVSWPDALAYCRWLEQELRGAAATPPELRDRLQTGWRVTLPSEAQWERAARGEDGRLYPWGDQPGPHLAQLRSSTTRRVGTPCERCAFGLTDLAGNVWEMTRSPYLPYPYRDGRRPPLDAEALLVMRGGSYADTEQNARSAVRGGLDPGARRAFVGFRIVLAPP